MLGDSRKAQEVFNTTLREAAVRAAQGELPREPFWLFREARWRCLEASKTDLQPESLEIEEHDIAPRAAAQIRQLEPTRSEEHTSELQSQSNLVCRLLLEKK